MIDLIIKIDRWTCFLHTAFHEQALIIHVQVCNQFHPSITLENNMVRVSGLYRIGFVVSDLDVSEDFYKRVWAMHPVFSDGPDLLFRSRCADHPEIMLSHGEEAKLHHVAFSVENEKDLHALLEIALSSGATRVDQSSCIRGADVEMSAAFLDPDGNRIELVVPSASRLPPIVPSDPVGPQRLGHVVLWTPQRSQQEAFYGALGFRVTDRTHVGMSFMRCNRDHHTLALVDSKNNRTGAQHTSFDVGTIDNVMREYGRLRELGQGCIWGVGRHGPGNNIFSYYTDPSGNVLEFYGEMEEYDDAAAVEPVFWGPEHKGDIWGVAGRPPQSFTE